MLQPFGAGEGSEHLLREPIGRIRIWSPDLSGFPPRAGDRAAVRRAGGVAWDSPGGEDTVCPWVERGGDSGRREGRRMRALRVRVPMGRAGAPNLEALAAIRDSLNVSESGALEREPPAGFGTPSQMAWDPEPSPPNAIASETAGDT